MATMGRRPLLAAGFAAAGGLRPQPAAGATVTLPPAHTDGGFAVERALVQRRSVRSFAATSLTLQQAGQLAWAAQGRSGGEGRRTAPSAGALYPLSLWAVAGAVATLRPGIYRYDPDAHALEPSREGDLRAQLADAAVGQRWIAQAPLVFALAADARRTATRYAGRADRFIAMEVGAAVENLLLQAVALGLAGTFVGALDESALRRVLGLTDEQQPLAIVPVGRAR
jgi:SagB-type dehydrogenase family enzyme